MENSEVSAKRKNLRGSEWFDEPGIVYFISAGSDCEFCKSIKIGVTYRDNLLKRLRGIQSSNHTGIRLLKVIEFTTMKAAEEKERELHLRFAVKGKPFKRSVGYEWFKASDELMDAIKAEGTLPNEMKNRPKGIEAIIKLFTSPTSSQAELLDEPNRP